MKWAGVCLAMAMATALARADDDLATIKSRFVDSILTNVPETRQSIAQAGDRHAATLKPDGSWPDVDYKDEARSRWGAAEHLQRLLLIAKACRIGSDDKAKALSALQYWLDHDYRNSNWWWNEIGVPRLLGETALLIQSDLSESQHQAVSKILSRSVWTKWTGQNLIWGVTNQIIRGCLDNDEQVVAEAYKRFYDEVRISPENQEGIQGDYSFHQHGNQFYSGGYGLAFAQDTSLFTSFACGTSYQIPPAKMEILAHYLLDGEAWMIRGNTFDFSAMGREITRKGKVAVSHSWTTGPIAPVGAAYSLGTAVSHLTEHPLARDSEFKAFAERLLGNPTAPPLVGNRHFWKSDYMSHRRAGYFASVRMFSDRLLNSEQVNNEGRKSQHLADGCCLIYRSGYEYTDIFPVWDWEKVPGTTAEQGTLDIEPHAIGTRGKTSFVGGASDGTYGIAAMDLERGKLKARKAWMFFDDEFVCLGSDITSTSQQAVATSVNQCWLRGAIANGTSDGRPWIFHDGVGYVFARGVQPRLSTAEQKGSWADIGTGSAEVLSENVFKLWIDHGLQAANASYSYIVLPDASAAKTEERAAKPDIEILSNTPQVQAARQSPTDRMMAAFYTAGQIDFATGHTLSVDQPCLLILSSSRVTIANPRNQAIKVHVQLDGKEITVDLPGGEMAGSGVTREVR